MRGREAWSGSSLDDRQRATSSLGEPCLDAHEPVAVRHQAGDGHRVGAVLRRRDDDLARLAAQERELEHGGSVDRRGPEHLSDVGRHLHVGRHQVSNVGVQADERLDRGRVGRLDLGLGHDLPRGRGR